MMEETILYQPNSFALCLGRSFGSGGYEVAKRLQQRLKVKLYDKELLDKAAENSHIRKELFEKADEQNNFEIPLVLGGSLGIPNAFYMYTHNYLSNDHLFSIQADTIRQLAGKGSAIFVGRCADYLLREHPGRISVFISNEMEQRAAEIKERLELETLEEAESEVEKVDKKRREYYNFYTSGHWGRADNYDLCLNLGALGIDYAVDIIVDLVRQKGFAEHV